MMDVQPTAVGTLVPLHLYEKGLLIRAVEQRLLQLFAEGKLFGTVHTCIGQEWTGVAVAEALRDGDCVFTNHRGHGHFLARTDDVDGLVAEIMGKQNGVCGGKGGSQHLCADGFYSNGVQGGMMPVAAGVALAQKIRKKGVSVIFVGDGTLGEGALYEALNIASKWDLPLLVVLENNLYAQSTSQRQTLAGDICARAAAFGIRTDHGDTWDPRALLAKTRALVDAMRADGRPAFLRVDTYRLMAHSKGDDNRDKAEVDGYWAKDPLAVFLQEHPEEGKRMKARVDDRVARAVARAEDAPFTAAEATDEEVPAEHPVRWSPAPPDPSDRMVNLIHAGLQRNMRRDDRILIIGEDIEGPYGGAFKATKDLSLEMPGRVRNTPISESAIVGLGNGLALAGMRPVCEIMFGDFLALCADQLMNHASKFRYMYDDKVRVPLVVRTPMGGKRGYGPTHSQSIEKHFLGLPGTRVLALHSRMDPGAVYDTIFASIDRPTIVIENKLLYAVRLGGPTPEGFVLERSDEMFPTTRLRPAAPADVTILCYGGVLPDAEKAAEQLFDEEEIVAEVVCPVQLYPLDPWPVVESVRRTGRLLVVEEGLSFAAFGAETIAQILESAPGAIRRVKRVASPRHPIPSCGPLEKALLPGPAHIVAAAKEIARA
jgi:2-oxoisovalerate dehydrogenase E1 component